jgi:single-stranded DNA-binding protein
MNQDGKGAMLKFSMSTYEGKSTTDGKSMYSHHSIVCFGRTAQDNLEKIDGKMGVMVIGKGKNNSYVDKNGVKIYTYQIIADKLHLFKTDWSKKSKPTPASPASFEDSFYDNTNFDPTPVDAVGTEEEHGPNF